MTFLKGDNPFGIDPFFIFGLGGNMPNLDSLKEELSIHKQLFFIHRTVKPRRSGRGYKVLPSFNVA